MRLRKKLDDAEIKRIRDEHLLKLIEFNITTACQFKCPGCYEADEAGNREDLQFDTFKQYIEMGLERGLEEIWLLGGEPTLHKQWKELLTYAQNSGVSELTLFSNMIKLQEEDIHFLKAQKIRLVGKLNIGTTTPTDQELYVQARAIGKSPEVAKKMLDKIDMILEQGLAEEELFTLENLLRSDNLPHATNFWRFCRNNKIDPNAELYCDFDGNGSRVPIPTRPEILDFIRQIMEMDRGYGIEPGLPFAPHITTGCPLNYSGIAVNYNGDVLPCAASKIVIANFNGHKPNYDVILAHTIMQARRGLSKETIEGDCGTCKVFDKCYGGCRNAVEAAGNPHGSYKGCITQPFISTV